MIRVLIAEPYKVTRECLRAFLQREQDMEVLGETDHLDQVIYTALQLNPDVILLDIDLQDSKGLETLRHIMSQHAPPAVVVLALIEDLAMKDEFLAAGAKAYYCWRDPLTEMLEAIRSVHAGRTFLSRHAANTMAARPTPITCS